MYKRPTGDGLVLESPKGAMWLWWLLLTSVVFLSNVGKKIPVAFFVVEWNWSEWITWVFWFLLVPVTIFGCLAGSILAARRPAVWPRLWYLSVLLWYAMGVSVLALRLADTEIGSTPWFWGIFGVFLCTLATLGWLGIRLIRRAADRQQRRSLVWVFALFGATVMSFLLSIIFAAFVLYSFNHINFVGRLF